MVVTLFGLKLMVLFQAINLTKLQANWKSIVDLLIGWFPWFLFFFIIVVIFFPLWIAYPVFLYFAPSVIHFFLKKRQKVEHVLCFLTLPRVIGIVLKVVLVKGN